MKRILSICLILFCIPILGSCKPDVNYGYRLFSTHMKSYVNGTINSIPNTIYNQISLTKDGYKAIETFMLDKQSDFQKVIDFQNSSLVIAEEARLQNKTYLELLLEKNNYTLENFEGKRQVDENGHIYRLFLLNNYLLIKSTINGDKINTAFYADSNQVDLDLYIDGKKFNNGEYISYGNNDKFILVDTDRNLDNFKVSDETLYICSWALNKLSKENFIEYEGCLYLPSENNDYYALVSTISKDESLYKIHFDTKVIADGAFINCKNLETIHFESLENCIGIGDYSFYGCDRLTNVNFPSSLKYFNNNIIDTIPYIKFYEENGNKYLGNDENNNVILVKGSYEGLNDNVRIICEINVDETIRKIVLPKSVNYLNKNSITGFIKMKDIEILNPNILINYNACHNYSELYYNGTISQFVKLGSRKTDLFGFRKLYTIENGEYTLVENPVIEGNINDYIFTDYQYLKSVKLVNTDIIGVEAFSGSSIERIEINSNLKRINENAFKNCENLRECYIDGDESDWCSIYFENLYANPGSLCHGIYTKQNGTYKYLTKINISNEVTKINQFVFYQFNSVEEVIIGDNVDIISIGSFADCDSLTTVILNCSPSFIGIGAFGNKIKPIIYFNKDVYEDGWDSGWNSQTQNY